VDDNPAMVEHLRGRGLDIAAGDAAEHLAALPDGKLDAVTAFHVVEHLDLESTLALLAHTARVLRPGGLLVLETRIRRTW
jgi:O-antigen chain-terminating methyltransferase